jgi:hypothetical protein
MDEVLTVGFANSGGVICEFRFQQHGPILR